MNIQRELHLEAHCAHIINKALIPPGNPLVSWLDCNAGRMEECNYPQILAVLLTWVKRYVSLFETMTQHGVNRISKLLTKTSTEENWLLKEVCQIFPATCTRSRPSKTKYVLSEQEAKACRSFSEIQRTLGVVILIWCQSSFCTEAWAVTLHVSRSVFPGPAETQYSDTMGLIAEA